MAEISNSNGLLVVKCEFVQNLKNNVLNEGIQKTNSKDGASDDTNKWQTKQLKDAVINDKLNNDIEGKNLDKIKKEFAFNEKKPESYVEQEAEKAEKAENKVTEIVAK